MRTEIKAFSLRHSDVTENTHSQRITVQHRSSSPEEPASVYCDSAEASNALLWKTQGLLNTKSYLKCFSMVESFVIRVK